MCSSDLRRSGGRRSVPAGDAAAEVGAELRAALARVPDGAGAGRPDPESASGRD